MDNSSDNAIREYRGSVEVFKVPEHVTVIGDAAFAGNKSLRHIDLGNVRSIGARAFQDCSNLESVTMSKAAVIGPGAFEFCRSLSSITFGDVTEIGAGAFSYCGNLDIPRIPRTLTSAGERAFSHTAVRRADIHWLEYIPDALFSCCTSLVYADVSGARVIGKEAFAGCRSLSHVDYGRAEKIEAKAFSRCDSFAPASLPDCLEYIGDDAFSSTADGICIPVSVSRFGKNCFGPVVSRKSIRIFRSALYDFRQYFRDDGPSSAGEDEHFYLWESAADIAVIDNETGLETGFLPLFTDLDSVMKKTLTDAFRPDNTFDYRVLDTVFFTEMRWNQRGMDRLAVMRLKHPYELTESARSNYTDYLFRQGGRVARRAVREQDAEVLAFLCKNDFIGPEDITGLLDYSISRSSADCTAILLERKAASGSGTDPLIEEL